PLSPKSCGALASSASAPTGQAPPMIAPRMSATPSHQSVEIPVDGRRLAGSLASRHDAEATILFAHGYGSGRHSRRDRLVAQALQDAGLGTLLFDLLEEVEAEDRSRGFDVELLADRLLAAAFWLGRDHPSHGSRMGYAGANTGAAAALIAAGRSPE